MSNETIFREVDEELRSDRMRNFWKRFGPYVIGGAVAVVLVVAVNEGWRWWQNSQAAQASDKFYAALEIANGTDVAAAQQAFNDVVAQGSGGYVTLARFRQAALLAKDGKTDEAIAAYDALSTSEGNPNMKALALVFAADLFVDKGDVAAVEQRVGGLNVAGNPMRNAARETLGLAQYKAGDLDKARALFAEIAADPLTSQEMMGRIQIYLAQLTSLGAAAPEPEVAAAPAASETSVGDAPAMDVTPATDAAPAADAPAATTQGSTTGN